MKYLAYKNDKGEEQSVKEHLENTAALCGEFADTFGGHMNGAIAAVFCTILGSIRQNSRHGCAAEKKWTTPQQGQGFAGIKVECTNI